MTCNLTTASGFSFEIEVKPQEGVVLTIQEGTTPSPLRGKTTSGNRGEK